ncbi:MAG: thioredoxin family protein [Bacteroidota bacterium]
MKKNIVIIFSLLMIGISCTNNQKVSESSDSETSNEGIKFFKGSFKEALAKAKAENKLIFMDAYASWCGPCKAMQKNTFPDPLVGKVFNEKFVSVAYDMEIDEGLALSVKYPIAGYPTLLFLDGEGNIIQSAMGYRDPSGLVALGQSIEKN